MEGYLLAVGTVGGIYALLALGLAAAALLASAVAWPLGLVCLRLRGDALAIVTLAFAEILRTAIVSEDWLTAGPRGIPGIPRAFASPGPEAGGVADLLLVLLA